MLDVIQKSGTYSPDRLFDAVSLRLKVKNDANLARVLEVNAPIISKMRHRRLPVGAAMLIRMHEVTGLQIADLQELMGERRGKFRIGDGCSWK